MSDLGIVCMLILIAFAVAGAALWAWDCWMEGREIARDPMTDMESWSDDR